MQVLLPAKFNEFCLVLGVKEMCCLEPEKKILEKAFRKKALKCHPDKGGDPIEFKKLNDAYLKLIGHIQKLDEQAEAIELANSVLIEISKASVKNWQSKLQTRYGWFKKENCKNIIFDGPYKQYMGRSKNTGNITVVLYEDPPDAIPKIHIRSSKYMAWIAEQGMPVHMHVEKGRQLAFDQWRIVHLAEFGIYTFGGRGGPTTPAPERKEPKPPKTPKSKRKGRDDPDQSKPKARRDSEPAAEPPKFTEDKENAQPPKQEESWAYNCGQCGTGFANLMDHIEHKKKCVPDTEFENKNKESEKVDDRNKQNAPKFQCAKCGEKFTNMVWYSKHQGTCNKTMDTEEDEYAEFMKSETSKNDLNSQSKPPDKKASEKPKKEETKSNVKDTAPKTYDAQTAKEPVIKTETTKEPEVKVKVNEKATESKTPTKEESPKMPEKSKDDPIKVRRFSAIIPDEPPEKFMDSPPKDIPAASCDHKGKETDPKHSRGEELTNGVTENGQKTKAENSEKKLNGVNNLNKDSAARPQNNLESDEVRTKKAGSTITKTGKITKTAKPELSKNGLSKAAEEVVAPKKAPTVEPMDVDEPEAKAKPALKKNEMPMGSLLKDLPASSSQAPNSGT